MLPESHSPPSPPLLHDILLYDPSASLSALTQVLDLFH